MTGEAHRLRQAREAAGFSNAREACERFGWTYSTYAGHENGSRGIKPDTAKEYAKAFRVESSWLLFGTGSPAVVQQPLAQISPPGLSDSDVTPYVADTRKQERQIDDLARALAPQVRKPMLYQVQRSCAPYAILKGDVLVIDATGAPPSQGAIVIVTLADAETGAAMSVLRQAAGADFIAPPGLALPDEETMSKATLGTVAAVMRPTPA